MCWGRKGKILASSRLSEQPKLHDRVKNGGANRRDFSYNLLRSEPVSCSYKRQVECGMPADAGECTKPDRNS